MKIIKPGFFELAQKVAREAVNGGDAFDWACAMVLLRGAYGLQKDDN